MGFVKAGFNRQNDQGARESRVEFYIPTRVAEKLFVAEMEKKGSGE